MSKIYILFADGSRAAAHNTSDALERWKINREQLAEADRNFSPALTPVQVDSESLASLSSAYEIVLGEWQQAIVARNESKAAGLKFGGIASKARYLEAKSALAYWDSMRQLIASMSKALRIKHATDRNAHFLESIEATGLSQSEAKMIKIMREGRFEDGISLLERLMEGQSESPEESAERRTTTPFQRQIIAVLESKPRLVSLIADRFHPNSVNGLLDRGIIQQEDGYYTLTEFGRSLCKSKWMQREMARIRKMGTRAHSGQAFYDSWD